MNGIKRLGLICAVATAAAALGGCVEDGYGYGGVAVGYAPGYDGYYDGYGAYGDPYYGAGYPGYYGWYGGYYYPGGGLYVYDRDRRPYRWSGGQRRYWSGQQRAYRGGVEGTGVRPQGNWNGFTRSTAGTAAARPAGQAFRGGGRPAGRGGHRR